MRASDGEGPANGPREASLPVDPVEEIGRDRDARRALTGDHEQRGGRPAYRGKRWSELVEIDRAESWLACIDDHQAKALAPKRGRRRECDLTRAEDDDPLEIDARPLGCERIERRRRIDPRHHPALSLRSGRGAQRERDLSHARWSDEGDRLAGS